MGDMKKVNNDLMIINLYRINEQQILSKFWVLAQLHTFYRLFTKVLIL